MLSRIILIFTLLFTCVSHANPSSTFQTISANDAVITAKINALYAKDKQINPFDISVRTQKGLVKLEGVVNSYTEYERALVIANTIDGVKKVDPENLYVRKSRQLILDTMITAKIKGQVIHKKLFSDKDVKLNHYEVETNNGHVYLSGVVNTDEQKQNLIKLAKQVERVKDVDATALRVHKKSS